MTAWVYVSYIYLCKQASLMANMCMCLMHRKQCYENHPWCRRDDDPNGTKQRIYISHQRPRCTAKHSPKQASHHLREWRCDCNGHQIENHWDFTGNNDWWNVKWQSFYIYSLTYIMAGSITYILIILWAVHYANTLI